MSKFSALDLGRVVAAFGRHVIVETPEGTRVSCHLRGKKTECVVGDQVRWQASGDEGVIEHIEPRRNLLFRQDDWRSKSFAANLDQILVLVAGEPMFSETQLARALIAAESAGIDRILKKPFEMEGILRAADFFTALRAISVPFSIRLSSHYRRFDGLLECGCFPAALR